MSIFRNVKLVYKFFSLIAIALALLITVGVVGYSYTKQAANSQDTLYVDILKPIESIDMLRDDMGANFGFQLAYMLTTDDARNQKLQDLIKERKADSQKRIADLDNLHLDQTQADLLKKFKEKFAAYNAESDKMNQLSAANRNTEAYELYISKVEKLVDDALNVLIEFQTTQVKERSRLIMKPMLELETPFPLSLPSLLPLLFCSH